MADNYIDRDNIFRFLNRDKQEFVLKDGKKNIKRGKVTNAKL